ncbi:MAG: hemolysin [Paenibacillus sp.]|nr:hemolysin [Paenibacillus sp.]
MNLLSMKEERANAVTHGIGALLSAAALVVLVIQAAKFGSPPRVIGSIIFGSALVIQYVCSTLLHCSRQERSIERYEMLDHAAIYLLIAGTYTPFLLITLNSRAGILMLEIIWLLALSGIIMKLLFPGRFMVFSIIQYIAMGWLIVFAVPPLKQVLPGPGVLWLLLGLLLYSVGSIFYFWRKIRYHHAVWHLFVMMGSFCHFVSVYRYVLV